jgi:hypothetical protein
VRTTVRATRLRRSERRALEAELAAHFKDGLDAGHPPAELAQTFGEPSMVAPLLRRAVKAKRHVLDRAFWQTVKLGGLGAAALLAIYVLAAIRLWTISPTIRFDPIERLNASMPEAGSSPAWPLYKEGLLWVRQRRAQHLAANSAPPPEPGVSLLGEAYVDPSGTTQAWTREDDIALLRAHQADLAALRAAAALPTLGYRARVGYAPEDLSFFAADLPGGVEELLASQPAPQPGFPSLAILLPQLHELRRATRLLAADAWVAIEDGESRRAAEDIAAMLRVADHAEQNLTLIGQLVGTSVRVQASQQTRLLLSRSADLFDEQSLALLADAFASVPDSAWRVDLLGERLAFEDVVQRVYSDDGEGDGVLLPQGLLSLYDLIEATPRALSPQPGLPLDSALAFAAGPGGVILDPGRRAVLESHRQLTDAAERESRLQPWDPAAGEELLQIEQQHFGNGARGTDWPVAGPGPGIAVRLLAPALGQAASVRRSSRTAVEAAATAVALTRYRRAHGDWPSSLDLLVPRFLAAIPRDPFDGAPLRYALRDGVPLMWSIGNDRIDDGGRPAAGEEDTLDSPKMSRWKRLDRDPSFVDPRNGERIPRKRAEEGDWILWAPKSGAE